jgi:hypothetical protein
MTGCGIIGHAILAVAVSIAAGCGKDNGRLPLSGKVSWQGRPLENGSIVFVPAAGHRGPKIGAEIVDGSYEIETERGATPGVYRVEVWPDTGEHPHSPTDARPGTTTRNPVATIPAEYNSKSRLTAAVSAEQTTFNFELPLPNK